MLLAADVGGTKTLIGLYRPNGARPSPVATRVYATLDFTNLGQIVRAFLGELGTPQVEAVCAGVAGPVSGLVAKLTNAEWTADLGEIAAELGGCKAALLNDLESMGYSVSVLESNELVALQTGVRNPTGNAALIAAGTGLNASHILNVEGRLIPSASESGHADFAARTPRELSLVEDLTRRYGRADVESVLSGPGFVNLFHFTHKSDDARAACPVMQAEAPQASSLKPQAPGHTPQVPEPQSASRNIAAEVTAAALSGACPFCVEALEMFVSAYGAETGNLALRAMASGGVYIGGGIAPKILPALQTGTFIEAFLAKSPMTGLLAKVPVHVILNSSAGLIGASVRAASLLRSPRGHH